MLGWTCRPTTGLSSWRLFREVVPNDIFEQVGFILEALEADVSDPKTHFYFVDVGSPGGPDGTLNSDEIKAKFDISNKLKTDWSALLLGGVCDRPVLGALLPRQPH